MTEALDNFEMKKVISDDRNKIIEIIGELLDERLQSILTSNEIYDWIKHSRLMGEEKLEIRIDTTDSSRTWDLSFMNMIDEMCFKKAGFIKKQYRFIDTDLKNIIFRLNAFQITDYKNLVRDVIENSKGFKDFIRCLENKNYRVSENYGVVGKSGCVITVE